MQGVLFLRPIFFNGDRYFYLKINSKLLFIYGCIFGRITSPYPKRGGGREIDDARTLSSKNLVINFLRDGIINNDSRSLSDVS